MIEQWEEIDGFEGKYFISNFGRVKSKYQILKVRLAAKTKKGKNTYANINLYVGLIDGKRTFKTLTVHREVAKQFLEDFDLSMTVNHKDGNRNNNRSDNLGMLTSLENTVHGYQSVQGKKRWGVYGTPNNTWIARIKISLLSKSKKQYLGCFKNEEEAYTAYSNKYKEVYGEFPW